MKKKIEILLKEVDFEGIELVQAQLPKTKKAKDKITTETFQLLQKGIDCQVKKFFFLIDTQI